MGREPAFSQSTVRYEELDRVIATTTLDEHGGAHDTLVEFDGYKRTLTNTLGQQRKETRDVLGQVTSVKDANGNDTYFDYEAFGALGKTTDPYGNIISVAYDRLGRKTHLYDPDLGHIEYGFDPPGRTISQVSPKQRAAIADHANPQRWQLHQPVGIRCLGPAAAQDLPAQHGQGKGLCVSLQ